MRHCEVAGRLKKADGSYSKYHAKCRGKILTGQIDGDEYQYCDECGAFQFEGVDAPFPSRVHSKKNDSCWDEGRMRSPDEKSYVSH